MIYRSSCNGSILEGAVIITTRQRCAIFCKKVMGLACLLPYFKVAWIFTAHNFSDEIIVHGFVYIQPARVSDGAIFGGAITRCHGRLTIRYDSLKHRASFNHPRRPTSAGPDACYAIMVAHVAQTGNISANRPAPASAYLCLVLCASTPRHPVAHPASEVVRREEIPYVGARPL